MTLMVYMVKCEYCKLIFDGLEKFESCPKCKNLALKVIATYPENEKECQNLSYQETDI